MSASGSRPFTGRISDADLRQLRVFCAVVRNGGFSAAEADLQISLSAISRDISSLETRMGFRLCSRGRSGFSVTREGEKFYEAALEIIAAIEDFRDRVSFLHADASGDLNVGLVDFLWSHPSRRIADAVAEFARTQRKVHLNLSVLSPGEIERRVHDATLDLGITLTRRRISSLAYEMIFTEENFLYCGEGHPLFGRAESEIDPASLRAYAFAGRPNPRLSRFYRQLDQRATCNSADLTAMLVLTGSISASCRSTSCTRWPSRGSSGRSAREPTTPRSRSTS